MSNKYDFDLISFGMRLKKLRKFYHKTQEEVAAALDVSVKSVQYWESGTKAPNIDNLYRLAEFYGLRVGEVLQDEEFRLFNKRLKSRMQTIETFEIPGYIETFVEITEDNYHDSYQIWVFDEFAKEKYRHASMARLVTYDEVKQYVLDNPELIVTEYREWLLSILTDSEEDYYVRKTIEDKINCEKAGMAKPGCIYAAGTIYYFDSDKDGG